MSVILFHVVPFLTFDYQAVSLLSSLQLCSSSFSICCSFFNLQTRLDSRPQIIDLSSRFSRSKFYVPIFCLFCFFLILLFFPHNYLTIREGKKYVGYQPRSSHHSHKKGNNYILDLRLQTSSTQIYKVNTASSIHNPHHVGLDLYTHSLHPFSLCGNVVYSI